MLISGQSAYCGGGGEKTSVASDQPDGEAQPLEESYKKRCNWAGEKDFHNFFVFFLFDSKGETKVRIVISFVVIELLGELHLLDARELIPPMLSC